MKDFKVITQKDSSYPKLLKEIPTAPEKLWVKGEIETGDNLAIAVVGARKITSYGRQVTENLVPGLASAGLTIVSGLARGVDSVAHRAALSCGGRTIAVLGSGIDIIYPPENKKLYWEIAANGAILTEFPPGTPPKREHFPSRNRIIAGLSLGVLVTEAAEISGSLITAGFAADFGREVFAVPGPMYSPMSAGTANLIKDGAKLVSKVSDILEELNLATSRQPLAASKTQDIDEIDRKILEVLQDGPKQIDEIAQKSKLPAPKILSELTLLEIRGMVKNLGGGVYSLK